MYGADGKTPELRPASIKGLMRFWWRAVNGDKKNLEELREEEAKIFGDTKRKSSFSIRVDRNLKLPKEENPLPHKKKGDKGYHTKKAFKENQTFQVIFAGKNLELISNIFKLSTILGGFGQRSRRGFGSIQIVGDEVLTSLNKVEDFISTIPTFESSEINYSYIKNIKVDKNLSEHNYFKLLEKIGKTSHKYSDNMFGSGNPRYASPLYISVIRVNDRYIPIFTTLHNAKYIDTDKLEQFKRLSYE
jgi:CRISPR-associated protein Cmr1